MKMILIVSIMYLITVFFMVMFVHNGSGVISEKERQLGIDENNININK